MPEEKNSNLNVDDLLNSIFRPELTLKELFEERIEELDISATRAAEEILKIQYRSLNGILNGTQKNIDFSGLIRLSDFLKISKEQAFSLYAEELKKNFDLIPNSSPEKIKFIKDNFDLALLKKAKFINNISDYEEIEFKINNLLGLNSIFEYTRPKGGAAFSAGKVQPKNDLNRSLWVDTAIKCFERIENPNPYDREALISYFPQIRWHSTNIELGLKNVIRELYKCGVTVLYLEPLPSLHLRGATISVNGEPSIILTDYRGYYPTIWFALIHELFHVIFDWEEIRKNKYHISEENTDQLSVIEKEKEANNFAREYLFSVDKTNALRPYIDDTDYIANYTRKNHVDPSFFYVFNAWDKKTNKSLWAKANIHNPNISKLKEPFNFNWANPKSATEYAKILKKKIYN